MEKEIAAMLVQGLSGHSGIIPVDKDKLVDLLVSADIPDSSRFYERLPDNSQLMDETGRNHYLSLRRILRNNRAEGYEIPLWKNAFNNAIKSCSSYSSDTLCRSMRTNKALVKAMSESESPFSLLGKLETLDFENPDKPLYIVTSPILVIPGEGDIKPIREWEDANTKYEIEGRVLFGVRIRMKIPAEDYFINRMASGLREFMFDS